MIEGTNESTNQLSPINYEFTGSFVALITPFKKNLRQQSVIDEEALKHLVEWHLQEGTQGIVAVGTTGEASVLSEEEHLQVLDIVINKAQGRIKVIAGCGSNNTANAVHLHCHAKKMGADAALHVTGYYNRPSQEGIYRHFEALSEENDLPIIVYNVAARTALDISVETMVRLSELRSVVGVKDASKDLSRPCMERRLINQDFNFLSGEDATAVAYNVSGGRGCISVTANVAPMLCAKMQTACLQGNFNLAQEIQSQLTPLHRALFREPSPAGVKYACAKLNLCDNELRLPMTPVSLSTEQCIDHLIDTLQLYQRV